MCIAGRPSITSVFPLSPVSTSSASSFFIPQDHTGPAITCVGSGWPRPSLEWRQDGTVISRSSPPSLSFDASVDAALNWDDGSLHVDRAATVSCTILGSHGDTNISYAFRLDSVKQSTQTFPEVCDVEGNETLFQVRLLDLSRDLCGNYREKAATLQTRLQVVLLSVAESVCEGCGVVEEKELVVTKSFMCGQGLSTGVVFIGKVTTSSAQRTSQIFCALSNWQQSKPLVAIDGQFYQLDEDCTLNPGIDAPLIADGRCASIRTTSNPTIPSTLIAAVVVCIVLVVAAVAAVVLTVVLIRCSNRNSNKVETDSSSLDKSTNKKSESLSDDLLCSNVNLYKDS